MEYIETSAMDGTGIKELFEGSTSKVLDKILEEEQQIRESAIVKKQISGIEGMVLDSKEFESIP